MQRNLAVQWATNKTSPTAYKTRNKDETGIRHIVLFPTRGNGDAMILRAKSEIWVRRLRSLGRWIYPIWSPGVWHRTGWPKGTALGCTRVWNICYSGLFFVSLKLWNVLFLLKMFMEQLHPVLWARWQITKSDYWLLHVCLSVRPHGKTRFPLDGFSLNLILVYLSKIYQENSGFIKIWQEYLVF